MKIRLARKILIAPLIDRKPSLYWMDRVLDHFGRVKRDHRVTKAIDILRRKRALGRYYYIPGKNSKNYKN